MVGEAGEEALHQIVPDGGASPLGPPPNLLPSPVCLGRQGPFRRSRGVGRCCSERPAAGVSGRSKPQVAGGLHGVLTFSSWNLLSKQQTPGAGPALTPDLPQCDPGSSAVVGLLSETACSPGRRSPPGSSGPPVSSGVLVPGTIRPAPHCRCKPLDCVSTLPPAAVVGWVVSETSSCSGMGLHEAAGGAQG